MYWSIVGIAIAVFDVGKGYCLMESVDCGSRVIVHNAGRKSALHNSDNAHSAND
jgi:hypothetical protein